MPDLPMGGRPRAVALSGNCSLRCSRPPLPARLYLLHPWSRTFLHPCRSPRLPGSANHVSLEQGQRNFVDCGAAERRYVGGGRKSLDAESRETGWRPLDPARDNIEEPQRGIDYADTYPLDDTTVLYYWRATYWRRLAS